MKHAGAWMLGWVLIGSAGCEVVLSPTCNARGDAVVDVHGPGPGAGGGGGAPEAGCPGPSRSGVTECFPSECGPGQFCDGRSGMDTCRPGCTSDLNCGPHDVCTRAGESAVGRCEPCGKQARRSVQACGGADRRGTTPCFPGTCGAGQYCVDEGLPHCEPGCTSDENCGPTERCERPDHSALGVCRSCDFASQAG